jgi:hypothetical protein
VSGASGRELLDELLRVALGNPGSVP